MKSSGFPYLLAAAETGREEPAHLSSALIPGGREGRQGAGPHSHPSYCSSLGYKPTVWAPPSIGQSSKACPHPCHEEGATEGWVWDTPCHRLAGRTTGREGRKVEEKGRGDLESPCLGGGMT